MARRSTKAKMKQYAIAGLLALVIVWLLWLVWGIARKEEVARRAVSETETELASLKERRLNLENHMAELSTARGQEAALRQTYGVAKAGEEVIIVVPPKEEKVEVVLPWHKKVLGWFGIW